MSFTATAYALKGLASGVVGQYFRYKARQEVMELDEEGRRDEIHRIREDVLEYQREMIDDILEDGLPKAVAKEHMPLIYERDEVLEDPRQEIYRPKDYWKNLGYTEGLSQLEK